MKLLWVLWKDASYQDGPLSPDDMDPLIEIETVGWLVRDDKDSLSLAMDLYAGEDRFRNITHIPKVNILKRKVLR